jgi:hypothetical protein
MKVLPHLNYFIKKEDKIGTFSAVPKDGSAINCIYAQHKKTHLHQP